jgi:hypothetical protein
VTELLLDQAAGLRKLLNQSRLRTIAVASAAAGDGRTTVTVNLAVALAQKGHDVLVLDADSGHNSAAWLLNAEPGADLLEGWHGAAGVERVIAVGCAGVRLICAKVACARCRAQLRVTPRTWHDFFIRCTKVLAWCWSTHPQETSASCRPRVRRCSLLGRNCRQSQTVIAFSSACMRVDRNGPCAGQPGHEQSPWGHDFW